MTEEEDRALRQFTWDLTMEYAMRHRRQCPICRNSYGLGQDAQQARCPLGRKMIEQILEIVTTPAIPG